MDELIKILPNFKKYNNYINDVKNNVSPIMLSGLTDTAKVHFAYSTKFYVEKPICIITYNEMQAKKIIKDLTYFINDVSYFPKREIINFDYLAESKENLSDRINCLNNIYDKKAKVIVTTIEAIMQKIITKSHLYKNILTLKKNDLINLENIKTNLINLGYERQEIVENQSEFSIRGGIIDVAISGKEGIRLELWGDEIISIRKFEINTQRSTQKLEKIKIYPANEFILEDKLSNILLNISKKEHLKEDLEIIKEGNYLTKIDKYFNSFYKTSQTFIDYIKDDYIIFIDEMSKIKARSENIIKDNNIIIKNLIEKNKIVPESLKTYCEYKDFSESIKEKQTIYLETKDARICR